MHATYESAPEEQVSRAGNVSSTRLQGRWLLFGRIAWVIVAAFAFSLFLLSLPSYAAQLRTICTGVITTCTFDGSISSAGLQVLHQFGISLNAYIWYTVVVTVLVALVWAAVGVLIFWRKSDDWMALIVAIFLVTFNPTLGGGPPAALVHISPGWTLPIEFLDFSGVVLMGFFFLLFPNGRFAPGWMGWILAPFLIYQSSSIFLPLNSTLNSFNWPGWLSDFFLLVLVGAALFSQIYRYRRASTPTERQQTRWVLFGIVVALVGLLALNLIPNVFSLQSGFYDLANDSLWFIILLAVPLSIGVAMLRSRLFDIDVLINRTLVYSILTAILGLIYAGLILALQSLTHILTGQAGDYPPLIVGSTLVIAALFTPLRRRIQALIDRRFYRHKYDAVLTLAAFNARLRNQVDLEQLREELITVVHETMQPAHVSLWLRPPQSGSKHQVTETSNALDTEKNSHVSSK